VCPEGPLERGQSSRDALLKLGVPTSYHEYPMGHELSAETLRELVVWLETKVLGTVLRIRARPRPPPRPDDTLDSANAGV